MKKKNKIKNINRGMLLIGSSLMLSGCTLKSKEQQLPETNDMGVQDTFQKETSNQYQGPSASGIDMSGETTSVVYQEHTIDENLEKNELTIKSPKTEYTSILSQETIVITPMLEGADLFPQNIEKQETVKVNKNDKYAKINSSSQTIIVTPTKGVGKQPSKIPTSVVLMYGVETQTPTIKPTKTPTPTITPTKALTPTVKPTKTPTTTPTTTPTPTIKPTKTPTPSPTKYNPPSITPEILMYGVFTPTPTEIIIENPYEPPKLMYGPAPTYEPIPTRVPTTTPGGIVTVMYGVPSDGPISRPTEEPTNPGDFETVMYGVVNYPGKEWEEIGGEIGGIQNLVYAARPPQD